MISVFPSYIKWHYGGAWKEIAILWKNFLLATAHFFSIKLLLKTFFSPFRRIKMKSAGGLDLEDLASTIVTNLLMRLVGIVMRTLVILIGLIALLVVVVLGISVFVVWLLFPVVILALVVYGVVMIVG